MARSKNRSTAEETYLSLRTDIIYGRIAGGTPLVEDELAELYNVSRTPIREAMKRLEKDGLVICYPYRGSFVKEFTEKDVEEIFTIRKALEGICCRVAAEVITEENIRVLEENHQKSKEALMREDIVLADQLGDNLHLAIRTISNNSHIQDIFEQLSGQQEYFNVFTSKLEGRMQRSLEEHEAILNALKLHDGDLAEQKMREHMDSTMQEMLTSVRNAMIQL